MRSVLTLSVSIITWPLEGPAGQRQETWGLRCLTHQGHHLRAVTWISTATEKLGFLPSSDNPLNVYFIAVAVVIPGRFYAIWCWSRGQSPHQDARQAEQKVIRRRTGLLRASRSTAGISLGKSCSLAPYGLLH